MVSIISARWKITMNRSLNIEFEYDDNILQSLAMSPEEFQDMLRIRLAVVLYNMGALSTGGAAEFAKMPKTTFLSKMSEYGIDTFDYPSEELERDVTNAQSHL